MREFSQHFLPVEHKYPRLRMTETTENKIKDFVSRVISAKKTERIHQIDNGSEAKRWMTGMGGELAVEALLRSSFVDWSVGNSADFNVSDLTALGLNVGIKTVEAGKFPVVHKKSSRPEIIVVKEGQRFYICGLATVEVLNQYQDDELIVSPKLRARNVKSGFYGFEHLISFRNIDELRSILKSLESRKVS